MVDAVSKQFDKFVAFATEKMNAGEKKAIATEGAVESAKGTPLEERKISVTDKDDRVGKRKRGNDAKDANDAVRTLFRKTVADMFGGENNIPKSVRKAMLFRDYGKGRPLTARRIIAVKNAIARLERNNVFADDKGGKLANKAFAAGYTRLDFGRLNTAANLLSKAENISLQAAFDQVVTKGSAANLAMSAGPLYMKDVESFRKGCEGFAEIAERDAANLDCAKDVGGNEVTDQGAFTSIATNLAYKFRNLLHTAETLRAAAKLPKDTLDELRAKINNFADEMENISTDIYRGKLKDGKKIHDALFQSKGPSAIFELVTGKIGTKLAEAAKSDPAIAEFKEYLENHINWAKSSYEKLGKTYEEAVAKKMAGPMRQKLIDAAKQSSTKHGRQISIPQAVLAGIEECLKHSPFVCMENIEKFCDKLVKLGDEALRFSDDQKKELKGLVEGKFGNGGKADKMLQRLVDQFETAFFSDELKNPSDFGEKKNKKGEKLPENPEVVLTHFKNNPDALLLLETGFKLDTAEDVNKTKDAITKWFTDELNRCLDAPKEKNFSLRSGVSPVGIREYNPGYVTFKGGRISNAQLGMKFNIAELKGFDKADLPMKYGYAEFLETKFDANHTKMRQLVSHACGMAHGLIGGIENLVGFGADGYDPHLKAPARNDGGFIENGTAISAADRHPDDNYDIDIDRNGDVTIKVTHIFQNRVISLTNVNDEPMSSYTSSVSGQSLQGPILSEVKFTATIKITNASDEELGDEMPKFTIDDIKQEEIPQEAGQQEDIKQEGGQQEEIQQIKV